VSCARVLRLSGAVEESRVVEDETPDDEQQNATSWTNPYAAEYNRRQAMLMAMRPFEIIAMLRDLNLTSYNL
jgi:hypothetical protein